MVVGKLPLEEGFRIPSLDSQSDGYEFLFSNANLTYVFSWNGCQKIRGIDLTKELNTRVFVVVILQNFCYF